MVHFILIYPVHLKVIWAVHLKCCNQRKQNRSLNNFVESVLMDAVYRTPNNETLAAMEEARESRNLETINLDNLEGFIESL